MSPWEFWIEYNSRVETARNIQQAKVGGRSVPLTALQEAQAKARKLQKAKKDKAQELAE
jgi:hypothetical protein